MRVAFDRLLGTVAFFLQDAGDEPGHGFGLPLAPRIETVGHDGALTIIGQIVALARYKSMQTGTLSES